MLVVFAFQIQFIFNARTTKKTFSRIFQCDFVCCGFEYVLIVLEGFRYTRPTFLHKFMCHITELLIIANAICSAANSINNMNLVFDVYQNAFFKNE